MVRKNANFRFAASASRPIGGANRGIYLLVKLPAELGDKLPSCLILQEQNNCQKKAFFFLDYTHRLYSSKQPIKKPPTPRLPTRRRNQQSQENRKASVGNAAVAYNGLQFLASISLSFT
jgi:hypothetical protein